MTMLELEIWGAVQVLVMALSRALACVWVAEAGLEVKTSGVERAGTAGQSAERIVCTDI